MKSTNDQTYKIKYDSNSEENKEPLKQIMSTSFLQQVSLFWW